MMTLWDFMKSMGKLSILPTYAFETGEIEQEENSWPFNGTEAKVELWIGSGMSSKICAYWI